MLLSRVVAGGAGGGGVGTRPRYLIVCLWRRPIGLSPPHIRTLCGPERVLVVSTEPPDDLSCLTRGVGRPGDGLLPVPLGGGGGQKVPLDQKSPTKPKGPCTCAHRLLSMGTFVGWHGIP